MAAAQPDVAAELAAAYEAWFAGVTSSGFDPIPAEVGHPGWGMVTLPGHEARLRPAKGRGIAYHGRAGWANDWIDKWIDPEAFAYWDVRVVQPGPYEATLFYRAPADAAGTVLRVECAGAAAEAAVRVAHDPPPRPSPDRVPRKEVHEYDWKGFRAGVLDLVRGDARIMVRRSGAAGGEAVRLKALRLRRLE